jgi:hypothetical protein
LCAQALSGQATPQAILFSSIAALTGPAGSSNYAAANALLDAAADRLQSYGVCAISVPVILIKLFNSFDSTFRQLKGELARRSSSISAANALLGGAID